MCGGLGRVDTRELLCRSGPNSLWGDFGKNPARLEFGNNPHWHCGCQPVGNLLLGILGVLQQRFKQP